MTGPFDQQPDPRLRFLHAELEEHARIADDIVEVDVHTWAIHGSIPVDGEVLMAEFATQEEAVMALRDLFGSDHLPPAS